MSRQICKPHAFLFKNREQTNIKKLYYNIKCDLSKSSIVKKIYIIVDLFFNRVIIYTLTENFTKFDSDIFSNKMSTTSIN